MTGRALITGATGFIGGRLVEVLALEHGRPVRALARDLSRCARIARFPIDMAMAGLDDRAGLDRALEGCDTVFHLAFDPSRPAEASVAGVRALAEAALAAGVRRFVHVSTISVYEPLPDGDVSEASPAEPAGIPYADAKLAVEREVLRQVREHGLPAIILQPTIVYGPFCRPWTDGPVAQLLSGTVVLPDGGAGLCNAVYVDDVVRAMLLAAEAPEALHGERFIISGAAPITWRAFYDAYAGALGVEGALAYQSSEALARAGRNPVTGLKLLLGDPKRIVRWPPARKLAFAVKGALNDEMKTMLKGVYGRYRKVAPRPVYVPNAGQLALFRGRSHCRIDHARDLLGYAPAFDFARGMALTAAYVRWAYREDAA